MKWLDAVFEGVLRSSCQAAVLIGLVLLLQWLFGRQLAPRWRYALWLLVLVRLTLPISSRSPCSLYNLASLDFHGIGIS